MNKHAINQQFKKGLLLYNEVDYEKNKWFANQLITKAEQFGLELTLVLRENLTLTIENGQFFASIMAEPSLTSDVASLSMTEPSPSLGVSSLNVAELSLTSNVASLNVAEPSPTGNVSTLDKNNTFLKCKLSPNDVDFVINRTRDTLIAVHFEKMGCRVFNNSTVTELCNHKGKTHQLVNSANIPSVKTMLGNIHYFKPSQLPFPYPVILKAVSGHGGSEIYKLNNENELTEHIAALRTEDFILQELCSNPGIDVRVFTLGKETLAAVKRVSTQSFKSNYSLGGSATAYTLKPEEEAMVKTILNLLDFDLAGIDFILDKEGRFLFNEIEDVVGTRTLYLNYNFDVVEIFLDYIKRQLFSNS